jgi:predicted dehydrogenase
MEQDAQGLLSLGFSDNDTIGAPLLPLTVDEFLKRDINRRQFLGRSACQAAGVAAGVMTLSSPASALPSSRVPVAVIGVRNRGRELATVFATQPDVELRTLCDVDPAVLRAAAGSLGTLTPHPLHSESDYRRVLDDPAIAAVVIATPDHTHLLLALAACAAGKDVYLESPVVARLDEAGPLLAAAAASQRIVQAGLQERSGHTIQEAIELLHRGRLGTVRLAKAWVVHRRKPLPNKPDSDVPDGVDYAGWQLGLSPRPFNPNRFHFNWRWFWDCGGGELSQWGSHLLDLARWGLQVDWPERVSATGGKYAFAQDATETPDTLCVQYAYRDRTIVWEHRLWSAHPIEGRSSGVAFYGERGVLVLDRSGWKVYDGEPAGGVTTARELDLAHVRNFIDSVRTRQTPAADLVTATVSAGLCHLGNRAYRAGRELTLDDWVTELA